LADSTIEINFDVELEEETELDMPKMFKVLLLNDDYTPMDFVIEILMDIFGKEQIEAIDLMLKVHEKGKAVCGIYVYDIAETKVVQVQNRAKKNEFPLRTIMEED